MALEFSPLKTIYQPLAEEDISECGSEEDLSRFTASSEPRPVEKKGVLSKWTNFFHGWQERYIALSNGTLSYYKSEFDTAFGCKGSISLSTATVLPHEFDNLRVDVRVNDCVYYLRANSTEERQEWVDALLQAKALFQPDQGYQSDAASLSSMVRAGSHMSLSSMTSTTSNTTTSSSKAHYCRLKEKILELETFRDIAIRQADTLQDYFDVCSNLANSALDDEVACDSSHMSTIRQLAERSSDFHSESLTFRATMSGIVATLQQCLELSTRREERLARQLEREVERRKKAEEAVEHAAANARKNLLTGGPDMVEGPFSQLEEEVFLDAIEGEVERLEKEDEEKAKVEEDSTVSVVLEPDCPYSEELEEKLSECLKICYDDVGNAWAAIHEDGDLKVYRREFEEGGVVIDPTKAYYTVKGITAYELCQIFFDDKYRLDWECTLDSFDVVSRYSESTVILHQIHKRIWPSSQRDVVFLSHLRALPQRSPEETGQGYVVCNFSVDHPDAANTGRCVRARCMIALVAHTEIPQIEGREITRDDITCHVTYHANINPGGWVPPSAVRAVSKREYPKFLRKFAQFALTTVESNTITFGPQESCDTQ